MVINYKFLKYIGVAIFFVALIFAAYFYFVGVVDASTGEWGDCSSGQTCSDGLTCQSVSFGTGQACAPSSSPPPPPPSSTPPPLSSSTLCQRCSDTYQGCWSSWYDYNGSGCSSPNSSTEYNSLNYSPPGCVTGETHDSRCTAPLPPPPPPTPTENLCERCSLNHPGCWAAWFDYDESGCAAPTTSEEQNSVAYSPIGCETGEAEDLRCTTSTPGTCERCSYNYPGCWATWQDLDYEGCLEPTPTNLEEWKTLSYSPTRCSTGATADPRCTGPISPPPPPPPSSPTPYTTPYLDPITLFMGIEAEPESGEEPLDIDITASVSGTATGSINYHFWWNCEDSIFDIAQTEAECGALPNPSAGSCATNDFGARCLQVNNTSRTVSYRYFEGIYRAKVIAERDVAPNATASVTISVAPLFVPQVIPNPFEASDPALAVFDAITALVVVGTPLYAVMLVLAGYYMLFSAGSAAGVATSKKIILYGTVGYGTIIVSWMTAASLTGILF